MSPLWRDEVGIHLSPARVSMVRLRRGLKPKVVAQYEHPLGANPGGNWEAALNHLAGVLTTAEWHKAAVRVVVADCWARYAIVPWAQELRSEGERVAHARQLMVSTYGEGVEDWEMRLSDSPPHLPRLACGISAELLLRIRTLLASQQIKLLSLQPQMVFAYENWRGHLPASGAWFVTIGEGTLAAARLNGGCWDRIHTIRVGAEWTREIRRLQTFGRLARATPAEGAVYVDAPQAWRAVAHDTVKDLHWLESNAPPMSALQCLDQMRKLAA